MLGAALLLAAWPWLTGQGCAPAPARAAAAGHAAGGGSLAAAAGRWRRPGAGHHQRFRAVVLVGGGRLVTSLTFVGLSAPDLALTQLSVEVVSTVLLLMGLALLPPTTPRESSTLRRWRDATLAIWPVAAASPG
jgi:multicomponent K+:H+ antiporter subunit A